MQDLREELNQQGAMISRLVEDAQEIRPVKQRRAPVTRPLRAETVCAYKHANVSIQFGLEWKLDSFLVLVSYKIGYNCLGVFFLVLIYE